VRRERDGQLYALKKMKISEMSQSDRASCLNEIRMLAKICHPNIIEYKEAFIDENHLCLVMEWAQSGDFLQLMMRRKKQKRMFSEEEICVFGREMANGLAALHKMKIIHRDVKAENFFLGEDSMIKLGDMNVSSISRNGMASTKMGTPFYISP
jgi:NIMA (never in mitosis gene a)-related kinase 1/4/5